MEYEICYLIGESKEANLDKIRPAIEGIIEKHKGTFLEGEFVKKRRLAYEIKREARGTYVARRFTIPSKDERDELFPDYDIMGEINKELRYNQDILRFMVVKTDDLPPLKDLEVADDKYRNQQSVAKEFKSEQKMRKFEKPKVEPKKEEVKIVEKNEIKEEVEVKPKEKVEEVRTEDVKEAKEAAVEEKPKKKTKKKEDKEDISLGDDIDQKLDEILNI